MSKIGYFFQSLDFFMKVCFGDSLDTRMGFVVQLHFSMNDNLPRMYLWSESDLLVR